MAQRVEVLLIDDIDGGDAAETIHFALDGVEYEIDVSEEHAEGLRTALDTYIEHARRIGGRNRRGNLRAIATPAPKQKPTRVGASAATIRAWAGANGIEVNDKGRIPTHIIEQFEAAN